MHRRTTSDPPRGPPPQPSKPPPPKGSWSSSGKGGGKSSGNFFGSDGEGKDYAGSFPSGKGFFGKGFKDKFGPPPIPKRNATIGAQIPKFQSPMSDIVARIIECEVDDYISILGLRQIPRNRIDHSTLDRVQKRLRVVLHPDKNPGIDRVAHEELYKKVGVAYDKAKECRDIPKKVPNPWVFPPIAAPAAAPARNAPPPGKAAVEVEKKRAPPAEAAAPPAKKAAHEAAGSVPEPSVKPTPEVKPDNWVPKPVIPPMPKRAAPGSPKPPPEKKAKVIPFQGIIFASNEDKLVFERFQVPEGTSAVERAKMNKDALALGAAHSCRPPPTSYLYAKHLPSDEAAGSVPEPDPLIAPQAAASSEVPPAAASGCVPPPSPCPILQKRVLCLNVSYLFLLLRAGLLW